MKTPPRKKTGRPKTWSRKFLADPWNDLDVQLELHVAPSLQLKFGLRPLYLEPIEMIYPKLHAREEKKP